jgi:DUF1009 family protein
VGLRTVEVMRRSAVTALAIDAGRTLIFERPKVIEAAEAAGIAIEALSGGSVSSDAARKAASDVVGD